MKTKARGVVVALSMLALVLASQEAWAGEAESLKIRFRLEKIDGSVYHFKSEAKTNWQTLSWDSNSVSAFKIDRHGVRGGRRSDEQTPGLVIRVDEKGETLALESVLWTCRVEHRLELLEVALGPSTPEPVKVPARAGLRFSCGFVRDEPAADEGRP